MKASYNVCKGKQKLPLSIVFSFLIEMTLTLRFRKEEPEPEIRFQCKHSLDVGERKCPSQEWSSSSTLTLRVRWRLFIRYQIDD